jgi:hypothetical protein
MVPVGVEVVGVAVGVEVRQSSVGGRGEVEARSVQGPIPSLQRLFDRLGLGFVAAQWAR